MDFAEIKPSLLNMLIFFVMLVVVANLGKFVFSRVNIPGLSDLVMNI